MPLYVESGLPPRLNIRDVSSANDRDDSSTGPPTAEVLDHFGKHREEAKEDGSSCPDEGLAPRTQAGEATISSLAIVIRYASFVTAKLSHLQGEMVCRSVVVPSWPSMAGSCKQVRGILTDAQNSSELLMDFTLGKVQPRPVAQEKVKKEVMNGLKDRESALRRTHADRTDVPLESCFLLSFSLQIGVPKRRPWLRVDPPSASPKKKLVATAVRPTQLHQRSRVHRHRVATQLATRFPSLSSLPLCHSERQILSDLMRPRRGSEHSHSLQT